ncbi:MAG: serine protease [Candidatus Nanoarchaeia archaeon]|nr:serine protease [Candidatus Nanoarchaeia archaeon]
MNKKIIYTLAILLFLGSFFFFLIQLNEISSKLDTLSGDALIERYNQASKATVFIIAEIDSPSEAEGMAYYLDNQSYVKTGSGFLIDPKGYIVTARHVISGFKNGKVVFIEDGNIVKEFPIIASADQLDLDIAILKINSEEDLPYLNLADEEEIIIGRKVSFVGFPYGDPNKKILKLFSQGVISGKDLSTFGGFEVPVVFINAFVNPGNSGGPVFLDNNGHVVGIVNQRMNDEIGAQTGIGVLSKASILKEQISQIKENLDRLILQTLPQ